MGRFPTEKLQFPLVSPTNLKSLTQRLFIQSLTSNDSLQGHSSSDRIIMLSGDPKANLLTVMDERLTQSGLSRSCLVRPMA